MKQAAATQDQWTALRLCFTALWQAQPISELGKDLSGRAPRAKPELRLSLVLFVVFSAHPSFWMMVNFIVTLLGEEINVIVSWGQAACPTYYTFPLIYSLLPFCELVVILRSYR